MKKYSSSFSIEGWNFLKWLWGNWKTVKEVIKVGLPLIAGWYYFSENPAIWTGITIAGKLFLDGFEFWLKDHYS